MLRSLCHRCGVARPAWEAIFAAALLGAAVSGCSDSSSDPPDDGGQGDAGLATDGGPLAADGGDAGQADSGPFAIPQVYQVQYLASNGMPAATTMDESLVNCWGLAIGELSPLWVASQGSSTIRSFTPEGMPISMPIPMAKSGEKPSGIAFNGERSFLRDEVIVATTSGVIEGWQQATGTVVRIDHSGNGARYKALAIARTSSGDRLYATNFSSNQVEIYDGAYNFISAFTDTSVPGGFAPYNVAYIDGSIYVTFAKKNGSGTDAQSGTGSGYIDVFDTTGKLLQRMVSGSTLNAPYGVVRAPRDFGRFSDVLLVANTGSDRISAYDPIRGDALGELELPGYQPLRIQGLHDIKFGNDNQGGPHNVLYFTAGPNGGVNGTVGSITPTN